MRSLTRRAAMGAILMTLAACAGGNAPEISTRAAPLEPPLYPNETRELRALINKYADIYHVPRPLVHRVVVRESTHRPGARNGPYYGLMQILPATARGMGFKGPDSALLDAETNLKYAVKYLRGAWMLSDGDHGTAVMWYARGYYYEAKRRGMLVATGLRKA
ncbi:transglycosylase SLT domain-containing protein [Puniceibacterium sp. IMCC21224]|uniref:transglycosylase SLT domain-containing protein n=1 Tax=Puniceibacterium sp. IMCC21224 TaxID=1618204 RepID=UPI00065D450A|nr:lytic transglycosylase domain-containing protein [Puniceibacterium sp. IMCC21224]KMK66461.1 transglycosylase family protein [Puniceibacterium sp. IMCC21224]